jgi:hypothetical protein
MELIKLISYVVTALYCVFYFSTMFYPKKISPNMDKIIKIIFILLVLFMVLITILHELCS